MYVIFIIHGFAFAKSLQFLKKKLEEFVIRFPYKISNPIEG